MKAAVIDRVPFWWQLWRWVYPSYLKSSYGWDRSLSQGSRPLQAKQSLILSTGFAHDKCEDQAQVLGGSGSLGWQSHPALARLPSQRMVTGSWQWAFLCFWSLLGHPHSKIKFIWCLCFCCLQAMNSFFVFSLTLLFCLTFSLFSYFKNRKLQMMQFVFFFFQVRLISDTGRRSQQHEILSCLLASVPVLKTEIREKGRKVFCVFYSI